MIVNGRSPGLSRCEEPVSQSEARCGEFKVTETFRGFSNREELKKIKCEYQAQKQGFVLFTRNVAVQLNGRDTMRTFNEGLSQNEGLDRDCMRWHDSFSLEEVLHEDDPS
jgi:hypothetical protein